MWKNSASTDLLHLTVFSLLRTLTHPHTHKNMGVCLQCDKRALFGPRDCERAMCHFWNNAIFNAEYVTVCGGAQVNFPVSVSH